MAKRTIKGLEGLRELVGQDVGTSDWLEITQERVNQFAEATGDHQWIHVDREKAEQYSPYKTTIAHGYLTISLSPMLMSQIMQVEGVKMGVNYGLNKLRFPSPVKVGKRVRLHAALKEVNDITGGAQVITSMTFEVEGEEKPCCVAEAVALYYF
ncbi:MAG TPA: MaoC family dehydratase [Gammaproteobacteria bacterium]|nr:MaoC family dehydratase [Gammaproteobacteria bacterium]